MSLSDSQGSLTLRQIAEEQLGKLKVQARALSCGQGFKICNKLQVAAVSAVVNTFQVTLVRNVMLLLFSHSLNIVSSDCTWQLLQLKMSIIHEHIHLTSPAAAYFAMY